jgi:hypothetical protein
VQPADGTNPLVLDGPSYFGAPNGALVVSSLHVTQNPAHGSVTVDPTSGKITYTAALGFAGTDTFGFTVTDVHGLTSSPAFISVIVTHPTAVDDNIDTDAGNPVTIPVLANDSSAAAPLNPASVKVVNGPAHGTVTLDPATGNLTYTSVPSFSGTDTFTYTVQDANGATSNPAQVSVVVNRPQANDDFAGTTGATSVTIPVLANDTDPDGPDKLDVSSVAIVTGPAHGSLAVDHATGNVTYTARAGFAGTDAFTYTVTDVNHAVSNVATVTIAVRGSGTGTTLNPVTIDTDAGNPVVIDVLAADSSPAGFAPGTVTVQTAPAHGSTAVDPATGKITYTPAASFSGTDTFTYTVKDVNGNSFGPATVSVVVNRPKANDDFASTDAGNPVTIPVLANDTDPDGPDKLVECSVKVVSAPAHGSVVVDPATGNVVYTPAAGFSGTDLFQYTVTDVNHAESNPATVNVVVNRPTANDDFGTTDSGFPITLDVLANDTDPDGPGKLVAGSVQVVTSPAHGSVTVNPTTGQITYTSVPGFSGTDTFTYTVTDVNHAVSNPATVSVVVNRPTANPDAASTNDITPVVLDVVANDTDPDGNNFLDPGSVTVVSGPSHGSVSVDGITGAVTYTPVFGFAGTDAFTYTIADTHGAVSNPATDSVTVSSSGFGQNSGIVLLPTPPPPSSHGSSDADMAFVGAVYGNVLGHPAAAAGLSSWVGLLQKGVSRSAVAQGIWESAEHRGLEVTSYYKNFLDRAPDAGGLAFWVKMFEAGAGEQQVALSFVTSPEFQSLHPTSDALVSALYGEVLGRTADSAGLAFWKAALDSGTASRTQVALRIANSGEALKDIVDAFYGAYEKRTADRAGEAGWLVALQGGKATLEAVAAGFLASPEYGNDAVTGVV